MKKIILLFSSLFCLVLAMNVREAMGYGEASDDLFKAFAPKKQFETTEFETTEVEAVEEDEDENGEGDDDTDNAGNPPEEGEYGMRICVDANSTRRSEADKTGLIHIGTYIEDNDRCYYYNYDYSSPYVMCEEYNDDLQNTEDQHIYNRCQCNAGYEAVMEADGSEYNCHKCGYGEYKDTHGGNAYYNPDLFEEHTCQTCNNGQGNLDFRHHFKEGQIDEDDCISIETAVFGNDDNPINDDSTIQHKVQEKIDELFDDAESGSDMEDLNEASCKGSAYMACVNQFVENLEAKYNEDNDDYVDILRVNEAYDHSDTQSSLFNGGICIDTTVTPNTFKLTDLDGNLADFCRELKNSIVAVCGYYDDFAETSYSPEVTYQETDSDGDTTTETDSVNEACKYLGDFVEAGMEDAIKSYISQNLTDQYYGYSCEDLNDPAGQGTISSYVKGELTDSCNSLLVSKIEDEYNLDADSTDPDEAGQFVTIKSKYEHLCDTGNIIGSQCSGDNDKVKLLTIDENTSDDDVPDQPTHTICAAAIQKETSCATSDLADIVKRLKTGYEDYLDDLASNAEQSYSDLVGGDADFYFIEIDGKQECPVFDYDSGSDRPGVTIDGEVYNRFTYYDCKNYLREECMEMLEDDDVTIREDLCGTSIGSNADDNYEDQLNDLEIMDDDDTRITYEHINIPDVCQNHMNYCNEEVLKQVLYEKTEEAVTEEFDTITALDPNSLNWTDCQTLYDDYYKGDWNNTLGDINPAIATLADSLEDANVCVAKLVEKCSIDLATLLSSDYNGGSGFGNEFEDEVVLEVCINNEFKNSSGVPISNICTQKKEACKEKTDDMINNELKTLYFGYDNNGGLIYSDASYPCSTITSHTKCVSDFEKKCENHLDEAISSLPDSTLNGVCAEDYVLTNAPEGENYPDGKTIDDFCTTKIEQCFTNITGSLFNTFKNKLRTVVVTLTNNPEQITCPNIDDDDTKKDVYKQNCLFAARNLCRTEFLKNNLLSNVNDTDPSVVEGVIDQFCAADSSFYNGNNNETLDERCNLLYNYSSCE